MKLNKLLILGIALIGFSLYSNGSVSLPNFVNTQVCDSLVIEKPNDELLSLVEPVTDALKNGSEDRKQDGVRLAKLYRDMSLLISVDEDILKTTEAIRQANVLSAKILKIDLRGKYEGLSEAADNLFKNYVSSDAVTLDAELRQKSSDAFLALAWGFLEGSK